MHIFWAIIFLLLALNAVVLRKTYFQLPARELKRRADRGDETAKQLYRVVAYGQSTRTLFWLYIGVSAAISFVLFARSVSILLAYLIVAVALWLVFSLLPNTRITGLGAFLTRLCTPIIAWKLQYLHTWLERGGRLAGRRYVPVHTGLFERDDVLDLVKRQKKQSDNRLTPEELAIIKNAVTFNDHTVGEVLTNRKKIKTILQDDTIGPILIDELHKSGQDYVLVRDKKGGMVVGSLPFKRLTLQSKGKVSDLMDHTVYYLHERDSLGEALHAFFVTNHSMFVVVNEAEEYLGIATIEAVLKELLGHVPGDDFEQYADVSAVAARYNQPEPIDEPIAEPEETPVKTDDEVVE